MSLSLSLGLGLVQTPNIIRDLAPASATNITTEASDPLITEGGDNIVTE